MCCILSPFTLCYNLLSICNVAMAFFSINFFKYSRNKKQSSDNWNFYWNLMTKIGKRLFHQLFPVIQCYLRMFVWERFIFPLNIATKEKNNVFPVTVMRINFINSSKFRHVVICQSQSLQKRFPFKHIFKHLSLCHIHPCTVNSEFISWITTIASYKKGSKIDCKKVQTYFH